MNHTFVYALWTDPQRPERTSNKILGRNLIGASKYVHRPSPLLFYCWGIENHKLACSLGFQSILVDERPHAWGNSGESMWRHKIEAWRLAMQDYDAIIFLDLDIRPLAALPEDFWTRLARKQLMQANLLQYRRRRSPWRMAEPRKSPSAAFVYLADKSIPEELMNISKKHPLWTEEQCLGFYADQLSCGWKGVDYWADNFEPFCCRLRRKSALPIHLQVLKEHLFTY